MTANGHGGGGTVGTNVLKLIVAILAQFCEYTKKCSFAHFQGLSCMMF